MCALRKRRLKPHEKRDKVNFQSLLDFASCPHTNSVPFVLIPYFQFVHTIINQIANYKWSLRVYSEQKTVWNAIAQPLHLRRNNNITSAKETHQIHVSQIQKLGIMKQHLYRSFHFVWLIVEHSVCFDRNFVRLISFSFRWCHNQQKLRKNSVYDINSLKRFIAQIGHIFI